MLTAEQKEIIIDLSSRFTPTMLGVFGSYARNESNENSDLDLLITFKNRVNLIDLIGLEQDLTQSLGIKVDLVTTHAVHSRLLKYIERDLIRLI